MDTCEVPVSMATITDVKCVCYHYKSRAGNDVDRRLNRCSVALRTEHKHGRASAGLAGRDGSVSVYSPNTFKRISIRHPLSSSTFTQLLFVYSSCRNFDVVYFHFNLNSTAHYKMYTIIHSFSYKSPVCQCVFLRLFVCVRVRV